MSIMPARRAAISSRLAQGVGPSDEGFDFHVVRTIVGSGLLASPSERGLRWIVDGRRALQPEPGPFDYVFWSEDSNLVHFFSPSTGWVDWYSGCAFVISFGSVPVAGWVGKSSHWLRSVRFGSLRESGVAWSRS
jgi:hypothetical protein